MEPEEQRAQTGLHRPEQEEHGGKGGVDEPVGRRPRRLDVQAGAGFVGPGVALEVGLLAAERRDQHGRPSTPGWSGWASQAGSASVDQNRSVCSRPSSTTNAQPWVWPADGRPAGQVDQPVHDLGWHRPVLEVRHMRRRRMAVIELHGDATWSRTDSGRSEMATHEVAFRYGDVPRLAA